MMSETVVTVDPSRNNGPPKPAPPNQSSAGPLSWITFNSAYFQTIPGILKFIQLVSSFSFLCYRMEKINWKIFIYFFLFQLSQTNCIPTVNSHRSYL